MQEQYTYGQKALFSIQTFMWDVNGIYKKKKKKKKADLPLVVWFFVSGGVLESIVGELFRSVSVSLSLTLNINFFAREFSNSY